MCDVGEIKGVGLKLGRSASILLGLMWSAGSPEERD